MDNSTRGTLSIDPRINTLYGDKARAGCARALQGKPPEPGSDECKGGRFAYYSGFLAGYHRRRQLRAEKERQDGLTADERMRRFLEY